MCGIAGFWRARGGRDGDCARLARMAGVLAHRGPDDFGYLYANSSTGDAQRTQEPHSDIVPDVLLASRRLAVTDLTVAGRQPQANETSDVFVVFNGAIHNYIELRDELRALGHAFHSGSDTEVVLRAYEQWGEQCAARFNGMWAYVIWDQRERRLVCSRDRFGIKPLFTATIGDTFYFASEAKAILAIEPEAREPNLSYIRHFVSTAAPREGAGSPFARIGQLAPGHNRIDSGNRTAEHAYWQYGVQSQAYDYADPARTFAELFDDAVRIRLRGDVPVALLLSGGMDSTAVAIHAARHAGGAVQALTARFTGFDGNESGYALEAAKRAGLPLTCVDYDPQHFMRDMERVTWHMDAPVARGQMLARWSLIREASRAGTILLEGQGADEMLGGYPNRHAAPYVRSEWASARWHTLPAVALRVLRTILKADNRKALRREMRREMRRKSRVRANSQPDIFCGRLHDAPEYEPEDRSGGAEPFDDPLTNALFADHARLILPYLLHYGDAISMGHSMESRLAFLDHRLVEFVFGLPYLQKIRGSESKVVLRRALGPDLPPAVLRRKRKVGFDTPIGSWLRSNYRSGLEPLLRSKRLAERELFRPEALDRIRDRFEARGGGAALLFRCAGVELWFRHVIEAAEGAVAHPVPTRDSR